ncbi:DUF3106 domain-containing protein [Acinetobacter larvae]|uniref:Restriction endonuclease n=1 Tax=Acinetobacter larvae TaxID=1789224 RepID=A0A1B2LXK2_9GAMM|nr:DUF3106 domain-containing protein [Acinetobacter larvae]AOA57655.1 restriction endonuclease [Acinetobacter larvae]
MAAKKIVFALCFCSFLQTSFAGLERFWTLSDSTDSQINDNWNKLSEQEQYLLIKRYQDLKEIKVDQSQDLQQKMDWFNQLPEQEKQNMREAWQKMSTTERNTLKQKLQQATTAEQRAEIRAYYLKKYNVQN